MWRKDVSDCAFFCLQISKFIDQDLEAGLKTSIENRQKNITTKDDWDTVQMTVSAHLI